MSFFRIFWNSMAKKLERVFRTGPLTPEEVSRDEEVRRRVQEEFPPARSASSAGAGSLSEILKEAIRSSNKSACQLAEETGISESVVSGFLSGERDIRMATADKLADALGLKLCT
jgi:ribosome-binding protein aMBF1 (putative translation factor)